MHRMETEQESEIIAVNPVESRLCKSGEISLSLKFRSTKYLEKNFEIFETLESENQEF